MHTSASEKLARLAPPKLILQLSLPAILGMLVSSLYNLSDTFFAARLGPSQVAAVGVVMPLMTLIQAVGMTFGMGAGSQISYLLGQDDKKKATAAGSIALVLSLATGLALLAAGLCFLSPLLRLLGATDTILPYAKQYAFIILLGAPLQTVGFVLNNTLRSEGNAVRAMVGIVLGSVLNVALDPLFMFALDWGMTGAALATVTGQTLSCLFLFWQYQRKQSELRFTFRSLRWDGKLLLAMGKVGLPTFLRQGTTMLATILLNRACMPFGDEVIAVVSIVSRILWFLTSVLIGFGQGLQPVAGYSFGARQYKRMLSGYRWALGYALGFGVVAAAACFFLSPQLLTWFLSPEGPQREMGLLCMRSQLLLLPTQAFVIVSNMLMQATGRAWCASILAMSRQGLCFVPLIFLLPALFGITGILLTPAASDAATFLIALGLTFFVLRRYHRMAAGASAVSAQQG